MERGGCLLSTASVPATGATRPAPPGPAGLAWPRLARWLRPALPRPRLLQSFLKNLHNCPLSTIPASAFQHLPPADFPQYIRHAPRAPVRPAVCETFSRL